MQTPTSLHEEKEDQGFAQTCCDGKPSNEPRCLGIHANEPVSNSRNIRNGRTAYVGWKGAKNLQKSPSVLEAVTCHQIQTISHGHPVQPCVHTAREGKPTRRGTRLRLEPGGLTWFLMMAAAYAPFPLHGHHCGPRAVDLSSNFLHTIFLVLVCSQPYPILLRLAPFLSASPWSHLSISSLLQAFKQGVS